MIEHFYIVYIIFFIYELEESIIYGGEGQRT